MTGSKKMGPLIHKPNKEDLNVLSGFFEAGKIVPVIDKHYRLDQIPEAFRFYHEGLVQGKIAITIA